MAKTINIFMNNLTVLKKSIDQILKDSKFIENGDLSVVDIDKSNPDEFFLADELFGI